MDNAPVHVDVVNGISVTVRQVGLNNQAAVLETKPQTGKGGNTVEYPFQFAGGQFKVDAPEILDNVNEAY